MASKYMYQRHLSEDYVRLPTLVSDGQNFRGSLEEFRRDDLPYFNALSWCWWSRGERKVIAFTCDGQLFPVSQHLYELLGNLNPKNADSSVRIWIDSICINQDHVEENIFMWLICTISMVKLEMLSSGWVRLKMGVIW